MATLEGERAGRLAGGASLGARKLPSKNSRSPSTVAAGSRGREIQCMWQWSPLVHLDLVLTATTAQGEAQHAQQRQLPRCTAAAVRSKLGQCAT